MHSRGPIVAEREARDPQRAVCRIAHIDMDAFYASVEQRDWPSLRGRPVAVGRPTDRRGVIAAASYEARRYGVRSAMPTVQALRLCPELTIVPPRFQAYQQVSRQIMALLREYSERVEPLSLDEAFVDLTANCQDGALATPLVREIKTRIYEATGLTASAGLGPSKLVAKIASELQKPNGLVVVHPSRVEAFLSPLAVRNLWGVGPATSARLANLGVSTVDELRALPRVRLEQEFGSYGSTLYSLARGDDPRNVEPERKPRSRGAETTFPQDIRDIQILQHILEELSENVARALNRAQCPGKTVVLKVRYGDFTTQTRSRTLASPTDDAKTILEAATQLLLLTGAGRRPVRLLGVTVANLLGADAECAQLSLPLGV